MLSSSVSDKDACCTFVDVSFAWRDGSFLSRVLLGTLREFRVLAFGAARVVDSDCARKIGTDTDESSLSLPLATSSELLLEAEDSERESLLEFLVPRCRLDPDLVVVVVALAFVLCCVLEAGSPPPVNFKARPLSEVARELDGEDSVADFLGRLPPATEGNKPKDEGLLVSGLSVVLSKVRGRFVVFVDDGNRPVVYAIIASRSRPRMAPLTFAARLCSTEARSVL
jgi:hypothetical protein